MRVAVVGHGTAGAATALLLAAEGHDVTVLEREPDPGAVGAGIWLQCLGQAVLDRLGLLDELRTVSRVVSRVDARTVGGRQIMDFGYADVPGSVPALGVHRGVLFSLLHQALLDSPARLETGVDVLDARPGPSGTIVRTRTGDLGPYDLVVGADGSRSRLRSSLRLAVRDRPYAYGALWCVVEDSEHLAGDALTQIVNGTREYFGVLPTGDRQASIFWSVRADRAAAAVAAGLPAWRDHARGFAGPYSPLLDRVDWLLPATYRDVVVRTPYRTADGAAAVLVGDAAHAMSPQLGAGTSLALADAWGLHRALLHHSEHADVSTALAAYARDRAAHVRWYQWWTRLLMPVFQSDLTPLALPRDALAPLVGRNGFVRRQAVGALSGDRTSPWTTWAL